MSDQEASGYAAYWDGYDIDCVKAMKPTRSESVSWSRGWVTGQEEDKQLREERDDRYEDSD